MDDTSWRERALMFMRGWFGEPMDDDTREELIRLLCAFAIAEMGARERRTKSVLNAEPGVPAAPSVAKLIARLEAAHIADRALDSRERAALDIAVKALRSVVRRTNSEPSEDWDSTLLNIGMIECDCRDAMSDIDALVPDAVK